MTVRIATRGSALALWQAEHTASLLRAQDPTTDVELVVVETVGDQRQDVPIWEIGGNGVFVKEVQAAVLDGRADIAVHSAKDLTSTTAPGLHLAAVPTRGTAVDALVGTPFDALPPAARVGTGSVRRQVQMAALRPDLEFVSIRGNMARRVAQAEELDAVVVAAVALERLGWVDKIASRFTVDQLVPQVGQGALGIECRAEDEAIRERLQAIEDPIDRRRVDAERAFLATMGGGCELPAGAYAVAGADGSLTLEAVLGSSATSGLVVRCTLTGDDPVVLGQQAAAQLQVRLADGPGQAGAPE